MSTFKLYFGSTSVSKSGMDYVELPAGKYAVGDVLVQEKDNSASGPRRRRKNTITITTLKITHIGKEYMSQLCSSGSYKACRYYGELTVEEVAK